MFEVASDQRNNVARPLREKKALCPRQTSRWQSKAPGSPSDRIKPRSSRETEISTKLQTDTRDTSKPSRGETPCPMSLITLTFSRLIIATDPGRRSNVYIPMYVRPPFLRSGPNGWASQNSGFGGPRRAVGRLPLPKAGIKIIPNSGWPYHAPPKASQILNLNQGQVLMHVLPRPDTSPMMS